MARPTLYKHPKFLRACHILQAPAPHVLGYLTMLWETGWQSGNPEIGDQIDIELAAQWPGEPGKLFQALLEAGGKGRAGFIHEATGKPGVYEIHDFFDHAPDYVAGRARKEEERKKGKLCESCGRVFRSASPLAKFCSDSCRLKRWRNDETGMKRDETEMKRDETGPSVSHRFKENTSEFAQNKDGVKRDETEMKRDETEMKRDETGRNGAPAPAPAPAPAHKNTNSRACENESENENTPKPSDFDPLKAQNEAKRLAKLYTERTKCPHSNAGCEGAIYALLNAQVASTSILEAAIAGYAEDPKRKNADSKYTLSGRKFFGEGGWEEYKDGKEAVVTEVWDRDKFIRERDEAFAKKAREEAARREENRIADEAFRKIYGVEKSIMNMVAVKAGTLKPLAEKEVEVKSA